MSTTMTSLPAYLELGFTWHRMEVRYNVALDRLEARPTERVLVRRAPVLPDVFKDEGYGEFRPAPEFNDDLLEGARAELSYRREKIARGNED